MKQKSKTTFIGLSHLGLVTSIGFTSVHPPVIGIDKDTTVIKSLKRGKLLIMEDGNELNEPGLAELFQKVKSNYYPTTDFSKISQANLVFFVKDTPKNIASPEREIFSLIKNSIPYLKENATVVVISQVPVGFCREVQNYIQKKRPTLSFHLYHWVDTIVMTNAVNRFLHPERIIIGADNPSKPFPRRLADSLKLFKCPVFKMSFESAEITKAAINLYLANSITFANTLSDFCEAMGGDINEIIPALKSDKRIGQYAYITPGFRIAGGHLERDLLMLSKLSKKKKISGGITDFILKQNSTRYKWVIKKLNRHLFLKIKNPIICIWGLSYKKDTTSTKNAASLEIIKALKGKAKINVYDPMAILPNNLKGYKRFKDKYDALKDADSLLVLTDWDEFSKVDISKMRKLMKNHLIINCGGIFRKKSKELKDFNYITMGIG